MKDEFTDEEKRGFYKAIYSRRDVRSHFISKPIEEEKLSKILHAAHHAPSVGFSQPWNFILIKDQETKKKMSKARSGSGNANWKGGINSDPVHKATVRRERMKDPIKRKEYNKKHCDYMNKRNGWTEERYKQLFDLYKLNLSNDQIAEHMGIARQSVVSQLKNHFNLING